MATVNLGQVAALIQSVSVEALDAGAAPTVKNIGTKANAQFVFGIPVATTMTHNIPRLEPKDITSYITDGSFWKRLNGTDGFSLFEDVYVGDYIKMSRPITAAGSEDTGSQYVTIAGLDMLMNTGDANNFVNYHHAIMVPGQGFGGLHHFGRARMNATATSEGGYKGSEMNTTTLGDVTSTGSTASGATINQQLYAEFGAHLKTVRERVTISINPTGYNRAGSPTGCSSSWDWSDLQSALMSEIEVFGSTIWSSSGFDTGNASMQLPLFMFSKEALHADYTIDQWLRDVGSSTAFCFANSYGYSSRNSANNMYHVRPRFVLGA